MWTAARGFHPHHGRCACSNHVEPLKEQLQNTLRPFPVSAVVLTLLLHIVQQFLHVDATYSCSECLPCCTHVIATQLTCVTSHVQVLHINTDKTDIDAYAMSDLDITGYNPHKKIAMKMAV